MRNSGRRRDDGERTRRRILEFVQEFGRREGYSPSYREIAEALGLAVSTVSHHVGILRGALPEMEALEDQVAAGQVCPLLQSVAGGAEQPLFVIKLEGGLVPGNDAVADLVRLGQPGPWFRLAQVHQSDPLAVQQGAQDPLHRRWLARRDLGREPVRRPAAEHSGGRAYGVRGSPPPPCGTVTTDLERPMSFGQVHDGHAKHTHRHSAGLAMAPGRAWSRLGRPARPSS